MKVGDYCSRRVYNSSSSCAFHLQIISKKFLIERDSVKYMRSERDVMTKVCFRAMRPLSGLLTLIV